MEGMKNNVDLPELAAPTPLALSENPNAAANRTYFMSSSALPPLPTSFPKPYFMNNGAADAIAGNSSSGTKTRLRPPNPLFMNMTGRNNNIADQNLYSESIQNISLTVSADNNSGTIEIGNGVQIPGADQKVDLEMDPRKLRRVLSNRLSAQKSRMKRLQHVADMEKKAEALEAQIAILRPQIEKFTTQKQFLQLEQQSLNQQIAACTSRKQHLDAQIEISKREVLRLRQVQLAEQQQNLQAQADMMGVWQLLSPEQMVASGPNQYGTKQKQTMYFNPNQADVGETTEEIMRLNELSLNQQQLENSRKMIPTPGWKPEQESLINMGFSFNRSEQAPSFNFNQSEPALSFSSPSFWFNHPEPGQSFVRPITQQLGYEGMNPSVLGELEKMLNIDPLNHDSRSDFNGLK